MVLRIVPSIVKGSCCVKAEVTKIVNHSLGVIDIHLKIERLHIISRITEQARAKQSHDISMQSLGELRARIDAADYKYDKAIRASEYFQKFMLLEKEKETT